MTLPVPGNPISMGQINSQLQYSSTRQISLNDTLVRDLGGNISGANSMSSFYGKTTYSATWSPSLQGGSSTSTFSYTTNALLNLYGPYLYPGQSIQFNYVVTAGAQNVASNGSYVYFGLEAAQFTTSFTGINYYNNTYFFFGNYTNPGGIIGGGRNPANASNVASALQGCTTYSGTTGGTLTGLTLSFVSSSGNTNTYSLYNGSGVPVYIYAFTDASSPAQVCLAYFLWNSYYNPVTYQYATDYSGMYGNTTTQSYGIPLATQFTINGTNVSYQAPDGCTQSQVISGMQSSINTISGVSAVSYPNGLQIVGATSQPIPAYINYGGNYYNATLSTL